MSGRRGNAIEPMQAQEGFQELRADYQAAKAGRMKKRRTGINLMGSGADYHYRVEADYLKVMEYARDMDRNDPIVGQMIDRAVLNIVQNGLLPDPKTGDPGLDAAIKERWSVWAGGEGGASECSIDGEFCYRDLEKLALRQMFVDGDDFTLLTDEGSLQIVEAHRCRTPSATTRNVVHGVLLDDNRKRLEYWLTKEDVDPMRALVKVGAIEPYPAFDAAGNRLVLHLRNPKRSTQTRGVTALAPVFEMVGFHDDLQFAKLVQQQVASFVAIIRERAADWKPQTVQAYGAQSTEMWDFQKRIVEEIAPGAEIRGTPGETIKPFSANVPNAEFFQQMRMVLQLIGLNLGLPLVLLMMDASDTNFSGWRGAVDQARMGFRDMQQHLIDHWEVPVYHFALRYFSREDASMRRALSSRTGTVNLFRHEWNAPRWPYIQPLQDAQADDLRQRKLLGSPRRIHAALAQDWDDISDETIEDNGSTIRKAIKESQAISKDTGELVTWREVLFMTDPEMLKAVTAAAAPTLNGKTGGPPEGGTPAGPAPLNGAQITAAVDVVGKLRSGTIASEAAVELLVGMGIERDRAAAVASATVATQGKPGPEDKAFFRALTLALAANPSTVGVVTNSLMVAGKEGVVAATGAAIDPTYVEPWVPVTVPAGQQEVTGGVVKDADGSVVGGMVKPPAQLPAGADGAGGAGEEKKPGEPAANPATNGTAASPAPKPAEGAGGGTPAGAAESTEPEAGAHGTTLVTSSSVISAPPAPPTSIVVTGIADVRGDPEGNVDAEDERTDAEDKKGDGDA